jgi:hypothetical protein
MSWLHHLIRQTATYWPLSSVNQYNDPVVGEPDEVEVRWEDRIELFIDTMSGDQVQSRSIIYTEEELAVGGYLYLGISDEADPLELEGADLIRRVDMVPDVKGRDKLYKVYL